ncbi:MAG: zinc-binding dehydrogenase, partial [Acidimicrobiia bacterium]|nr:zinc-binding dehydrogenase [Acidimicrobiia bacterium]
KLAIPAALGAKTTTNPNELQPVPVTYEASGSIPGLRTALEATADGGRTVVVGLQKTDTALDLHHLSITERELVGTNAHRFGEDFEMAARLVGARDGDWSDFMGNPHPLEDLTGVVLPAMADGSSTQIKHVFNPGL